MSNVKYQKYQEVPRSPEVRFFSLVICPLGFDPEKIHGRPYNLVCCVGLNPLPVSEST